MASTANKASSKKSSGSSAGKHGSGSHLSSPTPSSTSSTTSPLIAPRKLATRPCTTLSQPAALNMEYTPDIAAHAHPQPVWPQYNAQKAVKETSGLKASFSDPDGMTVLPSSVQPLVAAWKRIGEIRNTDKLCVYPDFSHGSCCVNSHPALADNRWANTITAYINLIITKRKLLFSSVNNFLTDDIHPQNSKDNLPRYSDKSKYIVRLFHQGDWRMVAVDDYVPVDSADQVLLPSACNQEEVWTWIIIKAICKVWKYDEFAESGGGLLYTLCGLHYHRVASGDIVSQPPPLENRPKSPFLPFDNLLENKQQQLIDVQLANFSLDESSPPSPPSSHLPSLPTPFSTANPLRTLPAATHLELSRMGSLGWYNEMYVQQYTTPNSTGNSACLFATVCVASSDDAIPFSSASSIGAVLNLSAGAIPIFGQTIVPEECNEPDRPASPSPSPSSPSPAPVSALVALTSSRPTFHQFLVETLNIIDERNTYLAAEQEARAEAERRRAAKLNSKAQNAKKPAAPPKPAASTTPSNKKNKKQEEAERRAREEDDLRRDEEERAAKLREEERLKAARANQRMEAWLRGEEQKVEEEETQKTTPKLKLTHLLTGVQYVIRIDMFCRSVLSVELFRDPSKYSFHSQLIDAWKDKDLKKPFSTVPQPILFIPIHSSNSSHPSNQALSASTPSQPPHKPGSASRASPQLAPVQTNINTPATSALLAHLPAASRFRRLYIHVESMTNDLSGGGTSEVESLVVPNQTQNTASAASTLTSPKASNKNAASKDKSKSDSVASKSDKSSAASSVAASLTPLPCPPLDLSQWTLLVESVDWLSNSVTVLSKSVHQSRLGLVELCLPAESFIQVEQHNEVKQTTPTVTAEETQVSQPQTVVKTAIKTAAKPPSKSEKEKDGVGVAAIAPPPPSAGGMIYRISVSTPLGYCMCVYSHEEFDLESSKSTVQPDAKNTSNTAIVQTQTGTCWEKQKNTFCKTMEGGYNALQPNTQLILFKYSFEVKSSLVDDSPASTKDAKKSSAHSKPDLSISTQPASDSWLQSPQRAIPSTVQQANQLLQTAWSKQKANGVCLPINTESDADALISSATALSFSLFMLDRAVVPYVRVEVVNNDTCQSLVSPVLDFPSMQFLPNQRGYTIIATLCCPYAVYAGKWAFRVLSSKPLFNANVDNNQVINIYQDEYKHNQHRVLARCVLTNSSNVPVSASAHFTCNVANAGLIGKLYDLDSVLEHPLHNPPAPLSTFTSFDALWIPLFYLSKDQRLLLTLEFDPLYPDTHTLQHTAGIKWCARTMSSVAVQLQIDKAVEEELQQQKAAWAMGDSTRVKKARVSREQYMETHQPAITPATGKDKKGESKESSKKDNVPVFVKPPPPISSHYQFSNQTPIVLSDSMLEQQKQLMHEEIERGNRHAASLVRVRDLETDYTVRAVDIREEKTNTWRNQFDDLVHEEWRQRADYRKELVSQEIAINELKNALQQTINYDEACASPFQAKDTSKESKKKKGDQNDNKISLFGFLSSVESSLPPVLALPDWKGRALITQAVKRGQAAVADAINNHMQNAVASWNNIPTTPLSSSRERDRSRDRSDSRQSVPDRSQFSSQVWNAVCIGRAIQPYIHMQNQMKQAMINGEIFIFAQALDQLERCGEPGSFTSHGLHIPDADSAPHSNSSSNPISGSRSKQSAAQHLPDYAAMEMWLQIAQKLSELQYIADQHLLSNCDAHANVVQSSNDESRSKHAWQWFEDAGSSSFASSFAPQSQALTSPTASSPSNSTLSSSFPSLPALPSAISSVYSSVHLNAACVAVAAAIGTSATSKILSYHNDAPLCNETAQFHANSLSSSSSSSSPPVCGLCFARCLFARSAFIVSAADLALQQYRTQLAAEHLSGKDRPDKKEDAKKSASKKSSISSAAVKKSSK